MFLTSDGHHCLNKDCRSWSSFPADAARGTKPAAAEFGICSREDKCQFITEVLSDALTEVRVHSALFGYAAAHGIAVIINQPFEQGNLFRRIRVQALPDWTREFYCASWAQLFLKYILAEPAVTCVIPATNNPEHMKEDLGAWSGRLPNPQQRQKIRELWDAS